MTDEIDRLPFDQYERLLEAGYRNAIASLAENDGKAIILRSGPFANWRSRIHVMRVRSAQRTPYRQRNAVRPIAEFETGDFPEAAEIEQEQRSWEAPFCTRGAVLYLIARTIPAFAQCVAKHPSPVPVYFCWENTVFLIQN